MQGRPYSIFLDVLHAALSLDLIYPKLIHRMLFSLLRDRQQTSFNASGTISKALEFEREDGHNPPEQSHDRLWEAVWILLSLVAERTPVLIILDEMGCSDSLSRDLFRYLARRVRRQPILFLGTIRSYKSLESKDPWYRLVTDLLQDNALLEIPVKPLSAPSIEELSLHFDQTLPIEQCAYIQAQSAGNPFFAEELARNMSEHIHSDERILPKTITTILNQRLTAIGEKCHRLLSHAAVLGNSFDFQVIESMEDIYSSVKEEDLYNSLEEAIHAGILTEQEDGAYISYHFWHPLLSSHLYELLSKQERISLHRRAAEIFCNSYHGQEEEGAALIVYHLQRGGDSSHLLVRYALLAGNCAYHLQAYPEAEIYYRLVLKLLKDSVPFDKVFTSNSPWMLEILWELLGECSMIQGHYEEACHGYEQALSYFPDTANSNMPPAQMEEYRALLYREIGFTFRYRGDRKRAWQYHEKGVQILHKAGVIGGSAWACLHYQAGHMCWREGDNDRALAEAEKALALFRQSLSGKEEESTRLPLHRSLPLSRIGRTLLGDTIDIGRAQILLAAIKTAVGRGKEATAHLTDALSIFKQLNCQREEMIVCDNLGDLFLRTADHTQAKANLQRALQIAEKTGDTVSLSVSLGNLGILSYRCGDLQEGERLLLRGLQIAKQAGDPIYISLCLTYLAPVLQEQGKNQEARECIRRALSTGREIPSCVGAALIRLGWMHLTEILHDHEKTSSMHEGYCLCSKCRRFLVSTEAMVQHVLQMTEIEAETRVEGLVILAYTALLVGKREEAQYRAIKAGEAVQKYNLLWLEAQLISILAHIKALHGQWEETDHYLQKARRLFHHYGMHLEESRTLCLHGTVLLFWEPQDTRDKDEKQRRGRSYLQEAHRIANVCGSVLNHRHTATLLDRATPPMLSR